MKREEILEEIKQIRMRNNDLWMVLIDIASKTNQGRKVMKQIRDNDKRISEKMGELIDD